MALASSGNSRQHDAKQAPRHWALSRSLLVVLVALVASSCDVDAGSPERTIPSALQALMDSAGPPQSGWLEDGAVTNSELEAAFLAAVSCVEEAGLTIEAQHHGAGDFSISRVGGSEAEILDGEDTVDECFRTNFELVASVYALLYGPTERERAEGEERFVSCANDLGVEGSSADEVLANFAAATSVSLRSCYEMEAELLRQVTIRRAANAASVGED